MKDVTTYAEEIVAQGSKYDRTTVEELRSLGATWEWSVEYPGEYAYLIYDGLVEAVIDVTIGGELTVY